MGRLVLNKRNRDAGDVFSSLKSGDLFMRLERNELCIKAGDGTFFDLTNFSLPWVINPDKFKVLRCKGTLEWAIDN